MIDPTKFAQYGTPWRVSVPLTTDDTLVIPKALKQGVSDIAGFANPTEHGIILLGFAYTYVASAAGVGFDLLSLDDSFNKGTSTTFTVWGVRSQAAGLVSLAIPECWIPLSPASIVTTPTNGATLSLDVTSTAPTSGTLLLWGIHSSAVGEFGRFGYSGSPADFS